MKFLKAIVALLILGGAAVIAEAQNSLSPGTTPTSTPRPIGELASTQSPYLGSISSEALRPGTVDLSIGEAIERGLRVNLGLLLSSTNSEKSRAEHWKAISRLLPHLDGALRESTQRINPRALGIPVPNLPPTVDVSNSGAQVSLTQSLFDLSELSRSRSTRSSEEAAQSDYGHARETVVVAVSSAYLLAVTAEARLHYSEADLKTAEALDQLARDRERAGLSPEVDTLRAHVELQARQEKVIEAGNSLAKRRITLLRLLGFDIRQPIRVTSQQNYKPRPVMSLEAAYKQALESRQDYRSEQQQLKSAELAKRAAEFERAPKIGVAADYGALGTAPGNAVPVWSAGVVLHVPAFEGGRIKADVAEADAMLRQRRAELEDTRTRIEQEVENALLDLNASKQQVGVAQVALGYANRALTQSKDRFSAGATNNIEVIQAQESLAGANEQWVNSLYAYNIARVLLARATGTAEANVKSFLDQGGPHK